MKKLLLFALLAIVAGLQTIKAQEAYAVYTEDNTTLTFYYDNLFSTRQGWAMPLNTGNNLPTWVQNVFINENVTAVVFDPSFANARPTTTRYWFYHMKKLVTIAGIEYLNTSEVTDMAVMFTNCESLTSLDLSSFNTAKVTDMRYMFYGCTALTSLDLSKFNTSNVTNMSYMFNGCTALTSLDLSSFNTANVTTMEYMFSFCEALQSLDLSSFNTASVTNMTSMFRACQALRSLDLSNFNTANVTTMEYMFYACTNLKTIYVGGRWSTAGVTDSSNMFYYCTELVGVAGTTYDSNHVDASYAHIDGGTSNPGYFTGPEPYAVFSEFLDERGFRRYNVTFYYDMNRGIHETTEGETTYLLQTTANTNPAWMSKNSGVVKVEFAPSFAQARPISTRCWFQGATRLAEFVGMENLNTSQVTDMFETFYNCQALTSLDLSTWDTSSATSMQEMFCGCKNLTSLNLKGWNTSNVTTMYSMFRSCPALTTLVLNSFNTNNVTDMGYMFYDDRKLQRIVVGDGWSTDKLTRSDYMFYGCTSLVGEKGTEFDASHVDAAYAHIDGGTSNPGYLSASIKGDVNLDGIVDIADAVSVLNAMAGQPVAGNANVNGDHDDGGNPVVDIADLVTVLNIMAGQ
ncbi:MAG: BspA family leucine-rich repeat surface protein [Bacteroidaceae bacterium]|nr:BspA family leucine-rich repeat surface protein [Bacteroidaceae bacterium]